MPFEEVKKVWMNGRLVDFADAKIHIFTHALHYGSGLFEGIRCYNTKNQGPAIFRLHDHTRRLYDSCKIYRMDLPIPPDEFIKACIDTVAANEFQDCYLRPVAIRTRLAVTTASLSGSRALVASSRIRMRGSWIRARAIARRWRCPPDRLGEPSSM